MVGETTYRSVVVEDNPADPEILENDARVRATFHPITGAVLTVETRYHDAEVVDEWEYDASIYLSIKGMDRLLAEYTAWKQEVGL